MARCARCWLHKSMRVLNLLSFLLAIGMIIYSLWLQKRWSDGVAHLPITANLPKPWFIYTCLGLGIAVCLSTLFGHMVTNCMNHSTLCLYIVTIFCLILLEAHVVVAIFFRMDWKKLIIEFIANDHPKLKVFLIFHLKMCQFISVLILMPQINVLVLAIALWATATSTEPRRHRSDSESEPTSVTQSFLVRPNLPVTDSTRNTCCSCNNLLQENLQ